LPSPVFFNRAGEKAVLPEMAIGTALNMLPDRKIVVQLTDSFSQGGFFFRYDREVDVVSHESISD
jgi:hypothetical protein